MASHPEDRPLTGPEASLVEWLLERGGTNARRFLPQLRSLRVVGRCACGCPSIDFVSEAEEPMTVLADFLFDDPDGAPMGVFLFARGERLAGLEVWSPTGESITPPLPTLDTLRPLE
jgi:hypothetical protein